MFDMDGLLLDSERLYTQAFTDACATFGRPFKSEVWQRCIGTTDTMSRQILAEGFGADFPLDEVLKDYRGRFLKLQHAGIAPMPGVAELLTYLHSARMPLAVITSTRRTLAGMKLFSARLADYFSVRVCGGEVAAGKPSPDPYLRGAQLLGLAPAHCLVLEDSPNGVRAGVVAGTQVIQVPDQVQPSAELLELGHTVHKRLHETLDMLRLSRESSGDAR
jgi:HAD superfamily hydrolase (TIGR01509 family)